MGKKYGTSAGIKITQINVEIKFNIVINFRINN